MNPLKLGETILSVAEAVAPQGTRAAEKAAAILLNETALGRGLLPEAERGAALAPSLADEAAALLSRRQSAVVRPLLAAGRPDSSFRFISAAKPDPSYAVTNLGGSFSKQASLLDAKNVLENKEAVTRLLNPIKDRSWFPYLDDKNIVDYFSASPLTVSCRPSDRTPSMAVAKLVFSRL